MGTIKVRRANRILKVSSNELEKYLASGYEIIQEPIIQEKQPSPKVVAEPAKQEKPAEPVVEKVTEPVTEVEIKPKKTRTTRRRK